MVVDIQGVFDGTRDVWTDPQIHSADGKGFGEGTLALYLRIISLYVTVVPQATWEFEEWPCSSVAIVAILCASTCN